MVYIIKDIIDSAKGYARPPKEELGNAVNKVKKAIDDRDIALVQGPPGTGKTTIFEHTINDILDSLSKEEILLYIAPTNQLVADMLKRVAAIYRYKGKINEIKRELRIYGSQFKYDEYTDLNKRIDDDVRLVLTTTYQRNYFTQSKDIYMLVDEASKSPLYQPFITMTGDLINVIGRLRLKSICVIGDPKQAITLGSDYKGKGKDLLIMNALIKGLLQQKGITINNNEDIIKLAKANLPTFELLDITYRMPKPTHEAVSQAFYEGLLNAKDDVSNRVKDLNECYNKNIARAISTIDDKFKKAVNIIENAISTNRGMIYIEIKGTYKPDNYGFNYEPERGEAGIYLATCLSAITGRRTMVLTTYSDQWLQMQLKFERDILPKVRNYNQLINDLITFSTVDKQIGSEEDIVVCILGKEYYSNKEQPTRYYSEPELLNVQLTRHKRLLCIIGNLQKLRHKARELNQSTRTSDYKEVAVVAETMLKQAGLELCGKKFQRIRKDTDCIYEKWSNS